MWLAKKEINSLAFKQISATLKGMKSLAQQATRIVEDKIKRIATKEYIKANTLSNGKQRKKYAPYTLPEVVKEMTNFISELADENITNDRIEEIVNYVTTGQIRELTH